MKRKMQEKNKNKIEIRFAEKEVENEQFENKMLKC